VNLLWLLKRFTLFTACSGLQLFRKRKKQQVRVLVTSGLSIRLSVVIIMSSHGVCFCWIDYLLIHVIQLWQTFNWTSVSVSRLHNDCFLRHTLSTDISTDTGSHVCPVFISATVLLLVHTSDNYIFIVVICKLFLIMRKPLCFSGASINIHLWYILQTGAAT